MVAIKSKKLSLERAISKNHKAYLQRKSLYKSFGYDVDREREIIVKKAGVFYGKILEAGTGKGYFALALAKKGYKLTSFDISKQEQVCARLNLKYFGLDKQVKLRIENGENLSFSNNSFDVIFSVNALHHLAHPYRVVDELIRVLSLSGKIILSDFPAKGFKMMDKIHKLEGKKHETGKAKLKDINRYLRDGGFSVKSGKSEYQEILIAERNRLKQEKKPGSLRRKIPVGN